MDTAHTTDRKPGDLYAAMESMLPYRFTAAEADEIISEAIFTGRLVLTDAECQWYESVSQATWLAGIRRARQLRRNQL